MGKVITFYSYKGGVGRTMALANIAVLLAKWGYKVLIIDWDLEAPGLELYFNKYLNVKKIRQKNGILDLLYDLSSGKLQATEPSNWENLLVKVKLPDSLEKVHFLTAGKRTKDYFNRVRNLNLPSLYLDKEAAVFIETLRNEWKKAYDYVLVDSRAGITDIEGVCTVQLPDILAMFFTANEQSLNGIIEVNKEVKEARQELPFNRFSLLSVPIPNRFDISEEFAEGQNWLDRFSVELSDIYANWLPSEIDRRNFLEKTKIPYIPYFSFGEKLAVLERGATDPTGLGYAYETLATLIANKLESAEKLVKSREEYVKFTSTRTEITTISYTPSVAINNQIVEYLQSLPNIENENTRRALVYGATLDKQLEDLVNFNVAGNAQFFQLLVHDLIRFGELQDGRDALEAVLKASKQYVGVNRKPYCDLLIQECQYLRQENKTFIPSYKHDILVSYAFRDNKPSSGSDDGWVTQFVEKLKNQMNQKLGGPDRYALSMVCLDQQVDGRSEIKLEAMNRLRDSAILVIILSQNYVNSYIHQQKRNDIAGIIEERTRLHSSVFLIEPDQLEDEDRPPEFCGLQGYQFLDPYSYTTRLYELSCDLIDRLQKLHRDRKSATMISETITSTSPKRQHVLSEASSQPSTVFIDVDQIDVSLGYEIADVLKKYGVGYIMPLRSGKASENRVFFEEAVAMCESLILVYGEVRLQWVIRQVNEVRKIIDRPKRMIIYDGPPEQKLEIPFAFPDIHILVCRKGVCEDELHKLIYSLQIGEIS